MFVHDLCPAFQNACSNDTGNIGVASSHDILSELTTGLGEAGLGAQPKRGNLLDTRFTRLRDPQGVRRQRAIHVPVTAPKSSGQSQGCWSEADAIRRAHCFAAPCALANQTRLKRRPSEQSWGPSPAAAALPPSCQTRSIPGCAAMEVGGRHSQSTKRVLEERTCHRIAGPKHVERLWFISRMARQGSPWVTLQNPPDMLHRQSC